MKLYLDTLFFDYAMIGIKKYELLIYDKKNQNIKLLEEVEIFDKNSSRKINTFIKELSYHKNITEAIEETGIEKILPNITNISEAVKIYEGLNYENGNYKESIERYGVLRIKF